METELCALAGREGSRDDMTECLGELAADDVDAVAMGADPCSSAGREVTRDDKYVRSSLLIRNKNVQDPFFFVFVNTFLKISADFTTMVAAFFATGFVLSVAVVTFAFLGARSFARIERSEAFRLHVPSIMSAGFSPGLALGDITIESDIPTAAGVRRREMRRDGLNARGKLVTKKQNARLCRWQWRVSIAEVGSDGERDEEHE